MKTNFYLKLVLGTLILSILTIASHFMFTTAGAIDLNSTVWTIISNFLVILILGFYLSHSTFKGLKLAFSVFVIYYLIGHFNLLIEAYIFNVTDRSETLKDMLQGIFIGLFLSPALVYLFNKWSSESTQLTFERRSVVSWSWRIVSGVFIYLVFYLTAGIILYALYPGLMDFYEGKIPDPGVMLLTQFPRGFLFVMITILILRTSTLSLMRKAILIGLTFSILGAIAPLIPPSELMPANIRLVHGLEVGISNFIYGVLLSYLLQQKNEKVVVRNELVLNE